MNRRLWTVEEAVEELKEWSKVEAREYWTDFREVVYDELAQCHFRFDPDIRAPILKVALALWPLSGGNMSDQRYSNHSRYYMTTSPPRKVDWVQPAECRSYSVFVRKRNSQLHSQHEGYINHTEEAKETERLWLEAGKKLPKVKEVHFNEDD